MKKIHKSNEAKIAVVLFIFFALAILLSYFWHSISLFPPESLGTYLVEYPRVVSSDNECIKLVIKPQNLGHYKQGEVIVRSNEILLASESFKVFKDKETKNICFNLEKLENKKHLIEVLVDNQKLFFHLEKKDNLQSKIAKVNFLEINDDLISFEINNFDNFKHVPIEIFVNDKLDHRVYPNSENQIFNEELSLNDGENKITLFFNGKNVFENKFNKSGGLKIPWVIGLAFFIILVISLASSVFSKKSFFEKYSLSIVLVLIVFIINVFILNLLSILSLLSFISLLILEFLIFCYYFKDKFSFSYKKLKLDLPFLIIFSILLVFVLSSLFHLFSPTYLTYWNGFYERQAQAVAESFSIPTLDPLSYFGRGFTFLPGYFLIHASFSWLTGLTGQTLFALILALGNLFFFLAVFYLGESLNINMVKRTLIYFFLSLSMFIFTGMTVSPRHIISFAFFLTALAYIIKNDKPWLTAIISGVNGFIQAPLMFFFPIAYVFFSKKIKWKTLLLTIIGVTVIFLVLFLPNLINYGFPYEARMTDWGYLIKIPLSNLILDSGMLLLFLVLFGLYDGFKGIHKFEKWHKKLMIVMALGLLIEIFISYRWNMFTSLAGALFLAERIPKIHIDNVYVARLIAVLIIVSYSFTFSLMYSWTMPTYAEAPFKFLMENTSTTDNVLSDPLFGHSVSFYAHRGVLADLYVEYADEEKLKDAYHFLEEKDLAILKKHNIKAIINQRNLINRTAMNNSFLTGDLEFEELDKVYSNNFIFVHFNK